MVRKKLGDYQRTSTLPEAHSLFHPYLRTRKWVFVPALIVGVFPGAFGEASGLESSLPDFLTILVLSQVAVLAVGPPRGGFPTILASNLHACSVHVSFGVVAALEKFATAGTTVSALLLDRRSSSTRCFDQDACSGEGGGRRRHGGGVEGTGIVMNELRRGRRRIITLRGAWGRGRAVTMKFSFSRVCAAGVITRDIPLAVAIVGDQARTHDEIIHAGGWSRDRLVDCRYEYGFPAQVEKPGIHPRCVQHWGREGLE